MIVAVVVVFGAGIGLLATLIVHTYRQKDDEEKANYEHQE